MEEVVDEPAAAAMEGGDAVPKPVATGPRPVDAGRVPIERRRQSIGTGPVMPVLPPARPRVSLALVAALALASLLWFNLPRPSLDISEVTSAGTLVADGTAHDLTVAFKAPRSTVHGIEVRAVDSIGDEAPRVIEVAPGSVANGRIAAGTIALQSEQPRTVTYRFVLLGDEGARSPPFDKTFEFAAAPPPPIVASQAPVAVPPDRVAVDPPVQAVNRPVQAGAPSAPRRAVPQVRKPNALAGCTRTTCGRIVATRAVESPQGVMGFFRRIFATEDRQEHEVWEVVVRRDDGTVHVVNDATRWNAGSRVRIIGDRLLAPLPRSGPQPKRGLRPQKLT